MIDRRSFLAALPAAAPPSGVLEALQAWRKATLAADRIFMPFCEPLADECLSCKNFFPQKKSKKDCNLLYFCIIILFQEEAISYHLFNFHFTLLKNKGICWQNCWTRTSYT